MFVGNELPPANILQLETPLVEPKVEECLAKQTTEKGCGLNGLADCVPLEQ